MHYLLHDSNKVFSQSQSSRVIPPEVQRVEHILHHFHRRPSALISAESMRSEAALAISWCLFHRTEEEGGAVNASAMCSQLMKFYLRKLCHRYSRGRNPGNRLKSLKTEFTNGVHQFMQPCRYDMIRMVTSDLIILPAAQCSCSNATSLSFVHA